MRTEQPVVAYFWAAWCQACKLMSPQMEKLAEENSDWFKVVNVDIAANPEMAEKYNIMSTSTLLLFKPGNAKPYEIQNGFAVKAYLAEVISKYI